MVTFLPKEHRMRRVEKKRSVTAEKTEQSCSTTAWQSKLTATVTNHVHALPLDVVG